MSKYNLSARKLVSILRDHDFYFIRQSGSHAIFKNFSKNKKVTVPIHSRDVPKGTAKAILKDADINL